MPKVRKTVSRSRSLWRLAAPAAPAASAVRSTSRIQGRSPRLARMHLAFSPKASAVGVVQAAAVMRAHRPATPKPVSLPRSRLAAAAAPAGGAGPPARATAGATRPPGGAPPGGLGQAVGGGGGGGGGGGAPPPAGG